ncbi:DNA polymerase zeta catalytic subunit isoform X2 [Cryptomeria japonica]|uniref:DNA polymerase zeta catalytic subunit isoform X2 n=1 Tax=Cryptomeria japonica TaxID=3369 RepID=UPI0027DAB21B|nr:DNA polymerase zeta catalytic subunit isoform X2 [Cryptomeria japonica]
MAPTFSTRIVCMDYYMSPPIPEVDVCYNPFQGEVIAEVPVIRIYGSTLAGQKTCLHVHQAFPYLYVPYDNDLPQNLEEGYAYVRLLASAIEKAMKLSSGIGAKRQHVHSCSLVRAKKFYGHYSNDQLFIKIILYYPDDINRVAALLLGGGILNHVFQPHESHIPYLLQFLIDHNLYGMGHIHLSKVKFRYPLPDGISKKSSLFRDIALKLRVGRQSIDDNLVALDSEQASHQTEVEPVTPSPLEYTKSSRRDGICYGNEVEPVTPSSLEHIKSSIRHCISNSTGEDNRNTPKALSNNCELWLRSKVPSEWVWSLGVPDFMEVSPCQGRRPPYKRQSTCDLEGDTSVQAGLEVKMVQSLIQIWEEECLRTGMDMAIEKIDDQKPSSERVLKTLSHGQEYHNFLSKLVNMEEQKTNFSKSYSLMLSQANDIADQNRQIMQAKTDGSNSSEERFSCQRSMGMCDQLMKHTQAANNKDLIPELPMSSPIRLLDAATDTRILVPGEKGFNVIEALVDEDVVRSQMTQSTELKDVDKEAIELLRWLASSQANTEDREDEEIVLSQLLNSDSIERVLEMAHTNFEHASQKECEEILSSILDVEDYTRDKSNHLGHVSGEEVPEYLDNVSPPQNIIPQVDGGWDDLVEDSKTASLLDKRNRRKKRKPISKTSDNISRGITTSSSSADESVVNRAVWGSLPLSNKGVYKDSFTSDSVPLICNSALKEQNGANSSTSKTAFVQNVDVSVTDSWEEKGSVNMENVDEAKELSLRDLMRKKRKSRTGTLELEHCNDLETLTKDRETQHGAKCKQSMNNLEKECQRTEDIHEYLNGGTPEQCRLSMVPKDSAFIQSFDLKECSGKYGNKVVDDKVFQYGPLPLVKLKAVEHTVEVCGEQHNEHGRDICNEEAPFSLKPGTVVAGEDLVNSKQNQAEDDSCHSQRECPREKFQDKSDIKHDCIGIEPGDLKNLLREECSMGSGLLMLKESVSEKRTCGGIVQCKEIQETAVAACPELQTCLLYASDSEDSCQRKSTLRIQVADTSNGINQVSQCNSHSRSWESEYGWQQQITPAASKERQCCSDDLLNDTGIKEPSIEKRGLLGTLEKPGDECQTSCKEKRLESESENLLHVSGQQLQLFVRDDSDSIIPEDIELYSESQKDCLEGKLFPLGFHKKPPTKDQIKLDIENGNLTSVEHGGVYYGKLEDLPDVSVVIAGSIFEVKSGETEYLHPFFMKTDQGTSLNERKGMDRNTEGKCHGADTIMGIPKHYENNGSVLYLLAPPQPPPSRSAVVNWLLQAKVESLSGASEKKGDSVGNLPNSQVDNKIIHTLQNARVTKMEMNGKHSAGVPSYNDSFKLASPKLDETGVSISGSDNSSQCAETYFQTHEPFSAKVNQIGNLNSLDQDSITKPLLNHMQCADRLSESSEWLEAHHISKKLQFEDENIPVSSPSKKLPDGKLQKEAIHEESPKIWRDVSQISAPSPAGAKQTPISQTGFRDPASVGAGQQLTLMSIEIHAESRGDLRPDPRYDAVNIIVAVIQEDFNQAKEVLVLMRDENANVYSRNINGILGCEIFAVKDEKTLFYLFIQLVRLYDPDILMGWEVQGGSVGFLAERAAYVGIGLLKKISRTPLSESKLEKLHSDVRRDDLKESVLEEFPAEASDLHETIIEDEWGRTHGSGIHVSGRIVLNLWRIMRGELNLRVYSLESVTEAVLRRKIPNIPWSTLKSWFASGPGRGRFRCIEYIIDRAQLSLAIMDQMDMINRTSELARVFGIEFFSVLSRGSQYRVESMMLRLAHTQNFLVVSPSKQQVASQPAMECLPLVMEPESKFYTDPVVVLDFQSLYPSMIIAYNLCYSTCLGKLAPGKTQILGVTSYTPDTNVLSEMEDHLFITPNGVMYVPPEVRPGVLPRLLQEILSTRIMVKNAMKKLQPTQRVLQRVLNARQLALKLIANVTYGYTAAGFSGRMPCAEIADSIVQCGRRTLENAINFVNSNSDWNARVVYGDTDSMFVLLKGRTREEAFRIGQQIASAITAINPKPVTLKMEKVYHPCVLLTKKRYVGYSYESSAQSKPTFDAKGIETVRRDNCPAVAKILEHSLRILFESPNLSEVKSYLYRQWSKILSGRVSLQDFIFAKEVRLGTYSAKASSLPPAAIVSTKAMRVDPRAEPHYGERVRYVVVHGEPGARLMDMVVDPLELLDINTSHRLHDIYYITKQIIPALQRVFSLVGVDLKLWYSEMPRPVRPMLAKRRQNSSPSKSRNSEETHDSKKYQKGTSNRWTIDHYYLSQHCVVCGDLIRASTFLCDHCSVNQCISALTMTGRTSRLEKEIQHLDAICRHCGGADLVGKKAIKCISLDCPVFYERRKVQKELLVVSQVSAESGLYPPCMVELF